jgi:sugar lactone lactonase YvrE
MKTQIAKILATATFSAVGIITHAQSAYIGNSLSTNGGPGGPPPLVILGEYSPTSPLAAASPGTTLTSGVVQDVQFYGQNYNFTLYALSLVANGPKTNEQTFRVVASEYFFGSTTNPTAQSLPASGFVVHAGDLLAFAGIGPYCATNANDALNSDATYEDSTFPGFLTATPPGGSGAVIIVGLNGDAGANYEYIPDTFGNQGRTYAFGVDVTSSSLTIAPAADGAVQVTVTNAATTPGIDTYFTALQADTNLNSSSWLSLTNFAVAATGGEFVDSAAAQSPSRFYRAQMLPFTVTNGIISTVAGGGATTNLAEPYGVTVDSSGNLFISDPYNSVIRELSTNGTFSTVAGNGITGFSGDGGPATNASLNLIAGNVGVKTVAVDAAGNIFIPDKSNNRIRKVNTNGIITTVAGNGTVGYAGDGGPATAASLDPDGPAVDAAGNLFIADVRNNRIRKVDTNGIITTVAGTGVAGYGGDNGLATNAKLNSPVRVALGPSGILLIADLSNQRIRKVNTNGVITTVAGNGTAGYSGDNGPATAAELDYPDDVVADASGNLFIADCYNNRIRRVGTNHVITTVAGNGTDSYSGDGGPAVNAGLYFAVGVAVDSSGNLFIADTQNERIREVSGGIITTVLGNGQGHYSGDGGPATKATLDNPYRSTLDAAGNCSSPMHSTTASAWSRPTASSPPWRAMAVGLIPATAARPPMPACMSHSAWRWTAPAISSSPITATTASAKSIPAASLPRLRAMASTAIPGMAAQPSMPS